MITVFAKDINKLSIEDQWKFYKDQFRYRHCCISGREVLDDWVIYEGELYKTEFYESTVEKEKKKAIKSIITMKNKIKEYEDKYRITNENLEEDE